MKPCSSRLHGFSYRQESFMRFCTLASSSSGNCAVIKSGNTAILIDAGISMRRIKQGLSETGLLPEEFAGKVSFAGNSCMGGLLRYLKAGKPLLRTEGTYLNLAEQPEFEKLYYRYMNFM